VPLLPESSLKVTAFPPQATDTDRKATMRTMAQQGEATTMSELEELLTAYTEACEHADKLATTIPPDDKAIRRADAAAGVVFKQLLSLVPPNVADLAAQTRAHAARAGTEYKDGHAGDEADRSRRLLDSRANLGA
jgi:hypothetical protein